MQNKKHTIIRTALLILALLSSPFACMGGSFAISALSSINIGLFQAEVRVENRTDETLYITPITTTYAEPQIIWQFTSLRQRDILLKAGESILLTYDAADSPLAGVILCRDNGDCRLFDTTWGQVNYLDDFDSLPTADESWLNAKNTMQLYNFSALIYITFALLPFLFLWLWWRLGKAQV